MPFDIFEQPLSASRLTPSSTINWTQPFRLSAIAEADDTINWLLSSDRIRLACRFLTTIHQQTLAGERPSALTSTIGCRMLAVQIEWHLRLLQAAKTTLIYHHRQVRRWRLGELIRLSIDNEFRWEDWKIKELRQREQLVGEDYRRLMTEAADDCLNRIEFELILLDDVIGKADRDLFSICQEMEQVELMAVDDADLDFDLNLI